MTPCSTHATAENLADTQTQVFEYAAFVNPSVVQNVPMYVMGDFNLTYAQNTGGFSGWWYPTFAEADERSPRYRTNKMGTTDSSEPIDYIFRRNPATYPYEPYIYQTSWSDHHWYEAYL